MGYPTLLLLATCVLAYSLDGAIIRGKRSLAIPDDDEQTVSVKDKTDEGDATDPFPARIPITFTTNNGIEVSLLLKKNTAVDASKTSVSVDNPKLNEALEQTRKKQKRVAFYQDLEYDAAFRIEISHHQGEMTRILQGTLLVNNQRYLLKQRNDGEYQIRRLHHENNNIPLAPVDDETDFKPADFNITLKEVVNGQEVEITEFPKENSAGARRKKRSTGDIVQFDVEVLFLLDHTIYDYWLEENGYNEADALFDIDITYNGYLNAMQNAYASIDANHYGIRIMPRLAGIEILTQRSNSSVTVDAISSCTSNPPTDPKDCTIDSTTFFTTAAEWERKHGKSYNSPDHLMVFTKYDVSSPGVIGVALISQICDGYNNAGLKGSISIVEENGFTTWAVMAHELAHTLGARHDGSNGCSGDSLNIMAPAQLVLDESTIDNAHAFSHCSIMDMKNVLLGENGGFWSYPRTCVLDHVYGSSVDSIDQYPGEVYSLEEQCEMNYGDGFTYQDSPDLCISMRCYKDGWFYYHKRAADGTTCDTNKWCMSGRCVDMPATQQSASQSGAITSRCSEAPSSCQDNPDFQFSFNTVMHTCANMTYNTPNLCWQYDNVRSNCPRSCHEVMCDSAIISPCGVPGGALGGAEVDIGTTVTTTTTQAPAGSSTCQADDPYILLEGMHCPAFCARISNDLQAWQDGWSAVCHYCATSCLCC